MLEWKTLGWRTFGCVWCETAIKYVEVYGQRGRNSSWRVGPCHFALLGCHHMCTNLLMSQTGLFDPFSFQKTEQKHVSTVSGGSGFLQSSCSKQEKSLCTMDCILSLHIWHLASVQNTPWLCKVSCLITRGKYTVLRLILPVSWEGCGILIPITGKIMFGGCRDLVLVGAFAFKKNFTWLFHLFLK